ncbi:p-loop containing nucleoside triphosphate hydrolase protein [Rutstroemia sp. NJR-2017a WRK4]|nr:p-loop containing nucleoside triphosphate hydrolase protein [Rutstroemia sp. NJR-2017a WRK4]
MSVELKRFMEELSKLRQAAKGNGNVVNSSVLEEVEQEREVESQIEEIRQVQRRTHYQPLTFPGLHKVVLRFAQTGKLSEGLWYEHAFEVMAHTSIGQKYNVCSTTSRLFISGEFMNTVMLGKGVPNDNFVRPVEWILWNPSSQTALIIISEEAELLIPIIRAARKPKVHLIAYAAPVTKNMLLFDELSYYTLPRLPVGYKVPNWLSIELGIFAGRLYFSFPEYTHLMRYLQLADKTNVEASYTNTGIFTTNPVNFLLDWLTLRRKGQDIIHTPMGYICQGRLLHNDHPFFINRGTVAEKGTSSSPENRSNGAVKKVDDEYSDLEDEWNSDLEDELDSDIEHR